MCQKYITCYLPLCVRWRGGGESSPTTGGSRETQLILSQPTELSAVCPEQKQQVTESFGQGTFPALPGDTRG